MTPRSRKKRLPRGSLIEKDALLLKKKLNRPKSSDKAERTKEDLNFIKIKEEFLHLKNMMEVKKEEKKNHKVLKLFKSKKKGKNYFLRKRKKMEDKRWRRTRVQLPGGRKFIDKSKSQIRKKRKSKKEKLASQKFHLQ